MVAALTMLVTLLPYLYGASLAGNRRFMWLGYNLDDSCVYLSWMRQAADGAWLARNLFTTDPQHGTIINPLFLLLGRLARITGVSLPLLYQASRLFLGFLLLLATWRLIRLLLRGPATQRLALLLVCASSGLGWLPLWWNAPAIQTPIDKWQPESITFLSLYLSPLFCGALLLQVAVIGLLYSAAETGKTSHAAAAGACGFLLGLVHTYDILSLSVVWIGFMISSLAAAQTWIRFTIYAPPPSSDRFLARLWLQGLLAGCLAAPAAAIMFYQFRTETVFARRVNVPTPAPSPIWVAAGYGLLLALAILGALLAVRIRIGTVKSVEEELPTRSATQLLGIWALLNVTVSYLPGAPFQRKLLQGAHFPIAILAAVGLSHLLMHLRDRTDRRQARLAGALVLLVLSLTNLRFMARDMENDQINRAQTMLQRPYLNAGEYAAVEWITRSTPSHAAFQPLPWIAQSPEGRVGVFDTSVASFGPGLTGHAVYCGHWGETPDFGARLGEMARFLRPDEPEAARQALLARMKVQYLIFSQKDPGDRMADLLVPMFRGLTPVPNYLVRVYSNPDADVYRVDQGSLTPLP